MCVDSLTSDKASVPVVLEKLLEHVEMHGLYTEGLYRKSGAANRTRELRQALQTGERWSRPNWTDPLVSTHTLSAPTHCSPVPVLQTLPQSSWKTSPSTPSPGS